VFEERWQPASHIFAVLSICEAFFFASAPTMAMLKAQGRFTTFLAWQSAQLVGSCVLLPIAALLGGGLAVAICATCLWAVGLPVAVWLSLRNSGHTIWDALRLFAIPWLVRRFTIASARSWRGHTGDISHCANSVTYHVVRYSMDTTSRFSRDDATCPDGHSARLGTPSFVCR
jgi:hypothetical protein